MLSEQFTFNYETEPQLPGEFQQLFKDKGAKVSKREDQFIITQSDDRRDVYYIDSGLVEVSLMAPNSKEYIYREIGPGNIIGEMAAIDEEKRSVSVTAVNATVLYKLKAMTFLKLLEDEPALARWIMTSLVKRIRDLSEQAFELSCINVRSRIALDLCRQAQKVGIKNDMATLCSSKDQTKIATNLGTHREAVSREYSALVRENLIVKTDGNIVIPSVSKLEKMVSKMIGI